MPIYDDLDDRGSHADFIERCRRDFETTGNPLYAWEAWGVVRFTWQSELHESVELPEWLGEYLDACGKGLTGIPMEVVERKPLVRIAEGGIRLGIDEVRKRPAVPATAGEGPGSMGRALGFFEGLAKAREHWGGPFDDREKLALHVVEMMWSKRLSLEGAAGGLDGRGTSRATAKRAVKAAQGYALRAMQNRLRQAMGEVPGRSEIARAYSRFCKARAK
ncbi:MAG: hypothetical protein IH974_06030 [Myxococcales bacterium]|nr:hypothetical protein [Myxococcales bacterium]